MTWLCVRCKGWGLPDQAAWQLHRWLVKMTGCLSCPTQPEPWGLALSVLWLFWEEDRCLKI